MTVTLPGSAMAQESDGFFRWQGAGLRLELAPLTRDQVRAFFIGRGFDAETTKRIADEGCVFRSSIGHGGTEPNAPPVSIDLAEWRVVAGATEKAPRTRQDWAPLWDSLGIDVGPKVAFKWALFPTRQVFHPTDYHWGLLTFGLDPGTRFDTKITWRVGGEPQATLIRGLQCAE